MTDMKLEAIAMNYAIEIVYKNVDPDEEEWIHDAIGRNRRIKEISAHFLAGFDKANEWQPAKIGNMPEYGTDIIFLNANGGYWAAKYYSQYNQQLGNWYTHYKIITPKP